MRLCWAFLLFPTIAFAQVESQTLDAAPLEPVSPEGAPLLPEDIAPVDIGPERIAPVTAPGESVILRGLDKMTGRVMDIPIWVGETTQWERLEITVISCRVTVPGEKPDAYAWLEIRDIRDVLPNFVGWMIASSPGINAMDHPRYDVWVTNCNMPSPVISDESAPQSE
jgi:hypothetical protein